ncbi:MAG TPA: efflux RND transporter periplasmic adaptor subunit [Chthoniobacteraceae bacterium]|jgi:putative peptide zinc metalloprotease protein|nr:efflux RND transporter periplasmic adaptor subunit [Chthoniobacteraceae bacterium]
MPAVALAPQPVEVAAPAAPSGAAQQEKVVLPPLRQDLIISRQMFEGRTFFVVKDPISLQYFRMSAEDYFLATLFDGRRNFGKVREIYLAKHPHVALELTPEEVNERVLRFANDLALMQMLSVQGQRLKARYDAKKKQKAGKGWFYNLVNQVFFMRRSLFDPDKLFAKMAKPIAWVWTNTFQWISVGIILAGVVTYLMNTGRIHPTMSNFFSFHNLTLVWVTTILIKSIHELGHGLTCKHFGGEVHEVGIMFLVFTPYFFVNISDSWTMPKRKHRMLISAAGIYIELVVAALACFLWAVVQPGEFQDFLFNVMVIASFSTIVFNANPLMRFDGYYIMTDLIEVPNLQAKSRALVTHQVKGLIFGSKGEDATLARMPLPKKRFWLFYIYAIASWIYGYYVIYHLTWFMSDNMAKHDLKGLGRFLALSATLAWVIMPFWTFTKSLQLKREDWKPGGRLRRLSKIFGTIFGVFALLCIMPWNLNINRSGAVELANPDQVRAEVAGFVQEVKVKEGDRVKEGQTVAVLVSRDVEMQLVANQARYDTALKNMDLSLGREKPADYEQFKIQAEEAGRKLEQSKKDVAKLELKARWDGTVLTKDLDRRQGHLLRVGDLFCEIGSLEPMQIKMALNEKQVRYVEKGQPVELKTNAYPEITIHGKINEVHAMVLAKDMPAALSATRSGDVPVGRDAHGNEVPLERTFEARIDVENPNGLLRPGMTSHGSIHTGRRPFGKLVLQSLLDLISLDLRF